MSHSSTTTHFYDRIKLEHFNKQPTYRFNKILFSMSHFTKIKTKLYNLETLKKSLSDLNIDWTVQTTNVRGYQNTTHEAELVIQQENKHDIGFKWNGTEYELVTDLMFWSQDISVDKFLNRVNQRYAYNSIIGVSEKEGFNFTQTETSEDGSIRLVLRRFN